MSAMGETAASVPTINALQRLVAMAGTASKIRCIGRQQTHAGRGGVCGTACALSGDQVNSSRASRADICWRGRRTGMAKVRVGLVGCGFAAELHMHAYGRVYGVGAEEAAAAARGDHAAAFAATHRIGTPDRAAPTPIAARTTGAR